MSDNQENAENCAQSKQVQVEGAVRVGASVGLNQVEPSAVSQVDNSDAVQFHLGIMRNVENEISRQKRKHTQNWVLVQNYLLGHTSKGGSTSCCIHCRWMGVDPEGYTFR